MIDCELSIRQVLSDKVWSHYLRTIVKTSRAFQFGNYSRELFLRTPKTLSLTRTLFECCLGYLSWTTIDDGKTVFDLRSVERAFSGTIFERSCQELSVGTRIEQFVWPLWLGADFEKYMWELSLRTPSSMYWDALRQPGYWALACLDASCCGKEIDIIKTPGLKICERPKQTPPVQGDCSPNLVIFNLFLVFVWGFLRFEMVPDTPGIICNRFFNTRWPLNLHNHRKPYNLDFRKCHLPQEPNILDFGSSKLPKINQGTNHTSF